MSIHYQIENTMENDKLLSEMSDLYSNHYGFWGETGPMPGGRIKLSKMRKKWKIKQSLINNIFLDLYNNLLYV